MQSIQLQGSGAGVEFEKEYRATGIRAEPLVPQGRGTVAATQLKSLFVEISRGFRDREKIQICQSVAHHLGK